MQPYDLDSIPVGGLVGPVEEFAPFLVAQLNNGRGILREETALQMREIAARGQAGFDAKVGTGLGWKNRRESRQPVLQPRGSGAGFTTETRPLP